jgi:hypothetical protein
LQKKILEYFDEKGNRVECKPKNSPWYLMYVASPQTNEAKFNKKFRRPYSSYLELVELAQASDVFSR